MLFYCAFQFRVFLVGVSTRCWHTQYVFLQCLDTYFCKKKKKRRSSSRRSITNSQEMNAHRQSIDTHTRPFTLSSCWALTKHFILCVVRRQAKYMQKVNNFTNISREIIIKYSSGAFTISNGFDSLRIYLLKLSQFIWCLIFWSVLWLLVGYFGTYNFRN